MTLLLNKADVTTKWVLTTYEVNTITTGSTIELVNQATNVSVTYQLPVDSSVYPDRYQEFNVNTNTFSGLSVGVYAFQVKDSGNNVVESGLLKVVDGVYTPSQEVANQYTYITPDPTADDFIEYQP
jgi:hypothetical protein